MGVQLPEWMAAEYTVIRAGRTTAVVRNDFVDSFQRHRLADCARAPLLSLPAADAAGSRGSGDGRTRRHPDRARRGARGSGGAAVPARRAGREDQPAPVLRGRPGHLRARRHAPAAPAGGARSRGPGGRPVPRPSRLRGVPGDPPDPEGHPRGVRPGRRPRRTPERVLESMGRAIRLLHEAGGVHADLNAYNILVQEEGEGRAFVIDLDRASVLAGPVPARQAAANLRRLRRSFLKIGLDGGAGGLGRPGTRIRRRARAAARRLGLLPYPADPGEANCRSHRRR